MGPVAIRSSQIALSFVIVVVLALQSLVVLGLTPGPIEKPPFLWPFLDYPMYSAERPPGTPIPQFEVIGTTDTGDEVIIEPSTLQTSFFIYRKAFILPFLNTSYRDNFVEAAALFEELHGSSLVRVQLRNQPLFVSTEGLKEGPPRLAGSVVRDADGDDWHWRVP